MNQNACRANMTDADSPILSMVEFLHGTGRKKESHIPSNDTFCCSIHTTPVRDGTRLPSWKTMVVRVLKSPTPPDPTGAFLSYMNIAIVESFT